MKTAAILMLLPALAPAVARDTFSATIAPILFAKCAGCHREGGVGPFPLLTYADAAKRASLIAKVTKLRAMPPWLPSAPKFKEERKLTDGEIAAIGRWAAEGAPEGNPAEMPKPPVFPSDWQLGKPDLEAEMRVPFSVPADGPDLYRCFSIPSGATRDRWVRALDIRPGSPQSVHHVLLFQDISGTARKRDTGEGYPCFGTPGFLPARGLGGWTPGALPFRTPADIPELLHANADLVLQIHYHPRGKPEEDRTRVALYFTERKPSRRMFDIPLGSTRIDIPPGERAYRVNDHFTIPVDVDAIAVNPHAHYVCKDMLGIAILPDGTRRTLIHIPQWNFQWQQQYTYAAPLRLPAGTRIEMEFTYDNSEGKTRVIYGPGSENEMAGLHLEVIPVDTDDEEELSQSLWGKMIRSGQENSRRPLR